jgi:hypothetical protein
MDSVEVPSSAQREREGDEFIMGSGGQAEMKIGSFAKFKTGSEHLGVMGEDEVHIASQAKDIIISS